MMNDDNSGSSLDALREYGIDVAPLEEGYKSKDAIIKYGKQLYNMRKNAVMTQSQLAKASGIAQADISRLERGLGKVGPSLDTMTRLANACKYDFSVSLEPESLQNQGQALDTSEALNLIKTLGDIQQYHRAMSDARTRPVPRNYKRIRAQAIATFLGSLSHSSDRKILAICKATKLLSYQEIMEAVTENDSKFRSKFGNRDKKKA